MLGGGLNGTMNGELNGTMNGELDGTMDGEPNGMLNGSQVLGSSQMPGRPRWRQLRRMRSMKNFWRLWA